MDILPRNLGLSTLVFKRSDDKVKIMESYNPQEIESRWQKRWEEKGFYKAEDFSKKPKKYILVEFPYPSGDGLHVGHVRSYSALDAVSRKKRMEGFNVLFPMGWDAFGLPTENFAIKHGVHPSIATEKNISNFKRQLKRLGLSFDWSREINTTDPKYYRWTQWIFLQLFKKGLAYQAEIPVNWCPACKIGLANEEAANGKCERCGTQVEKKILKQWMIKITKYADRLIEDLKEVDFPERVKTQQINWIGKSEGAEIDFPVFFPLAASKPKNCLIIHGVLGSSRENWFPWLKKNLENQGFEVSVPNLPHADHPVIGEWNKALEKEFAPDSVIVGHSLGAPAALNLVQTVGKKIDKLILVAPVNPEQNWKDLEKNEPGVDWEAVKNFADIKFDWAKISGLANKIIFYYSDNDKYIPAQSVDYYKKHLPKAEFRFIKNKGHFNTSSGIKEFPEVLDEFFPKIKVFTTRPDTLFGVTYIVVAPEHDIISNLKSQISNFSEIENYINESKKKSDLERTELIKEKTGVELKGLRAINPANNEEVPIFVADYVLSTYGTGAVMAVPAHDQRDFEFAKRYYLPIKMVICPNWPKEVCPVLDKAYEDEGHLVDSREFDGIKSEDARDKITQWLEKKRLGRKMIQYKLRDWVFSRQHYWGEPIPIIHCQKCGVVPVSEKDLPVELPFVKNYQPTGTGESPLAAISDWVNVKCPKCGGSAKRETDTMPNWAGSNWYYLRYLDPENNKALAKPEKIKYWMPVDWYNGGMEHTTLHLLYSRFIYKFLFDTGVVPQKEPYQKRTSHGMVLAEDGKKMSKSLGNVINPDDIVEKYGADTLRLYEMFMGPFEQAIAWATNGLNGCHRFLERVWKLVLESLENKENGQKPLKAVNELNKKIDDDLEAMKLNTIVAAFMEFVNLVYDYKKELGKETIKKFLILLSPFAPHIAEELWNQLGNKNSIFFENWPKPDGKFLMDETIILIIQINGKIRDKIEAPADISEEEAKNLALSQEKVRVWIEGKEIKKIIFVKNKLINLVM